MESHEFKTRVPHGYCLRPLTQPVCPHANSCEFCPSLVPLTSGRPAVEQQLQDARLLAKDATARRWDDEARRHRELAGRLEGLLSALPESGQGKKKRKNTN